ncbi:LysR family transcriptional regulator [Bordetella genomosp. 13]|uniref:LysR family transcriptional regulator n=1 Tax=Bordetella genomosp. 13 TaxID=463040 RepID=UPI0011A5D4C9|nr:LysR family transcriptional regulator [Bordetella genomosp. 13]
MQQSLFSDLNELVAFVALADTGSFSAAGRQLGRDPTAISRRLSAMEKRMGVRLAERSTRKVALTEAGRTYLERIRPLLQELQAAGRETTAFADGEARGHLRITLPGTFGRMWLTPLIVEFLRAHPRVTIEVDTSNRFVDLIGERFDLAIRLGELPDSRLVARKVAERRRLVCASPDLLARHPDLKTPLDLKDMPCLCFTGLQDPYKWNFVKRGGGSLGVTVAGPLAADDGELLVDAAVNGLGVLYTSDWYTSRELSAGRLVEVLPGWALADRGAVYVVTPAAAGTPSKTRAFSNWMAEKLATPPWAVPR